MRKILYKAEEENIIIRDSNIFPLVSNFCSVIEDNVDSCDLDIFKQNIKSLTIEKRIYLLRNLLSLILNRLCTSDTYDKSNNTITIIENYFFKEPLVAGDIYHEMLHMASSIMDTNKNLNSGLSFSDKYGKVLADGLNEGYTEVLNRSFFGKGLDYGYDYETIIASLVEAITSKENMISYYFRARGELLIEDMTNYQKESEVYTFLEDLDELSFYGYDKFMFPRRNRDMIEMFENSNAFLIRSYLNKLELLVGNGTINEKDFCFMLDLFTREMKKIERIDYFLPMCDKKDIIKFTIVDTGAQKILRRKF